MMKAPIPTIPNTDSTSKICQITFFGRLHGHFIFSIYMLVVAYPSLSSFNLFSFDSFF